MKKKNISGATSGLLDVLETRFHEHPHRHQGVKWSEVSEKINADPQLFRALDQMEETGGEPDVVLLPGKKNALAFIDCSTESPSGRRSLCFDQKAWKDRKENKPAGSAMEFANEIGIEMLDEETYRHLQTLEHFDLKTSSWIATPESIRKLDGALFCDRRYNHVFTYHNSAQSYYAARGFRGMINI